MEGGRALETITRGPITISIYVYIMYEERNEKYSYAQNVADRGRKSQIGHFVRPIGVTMWRITISIYATANKSLKFLHLHSSKSKMEEPGKLHSGMINRLLVTESYQEFTETTLKMSLLGNENWLVIAPGSVIMRIVQQCKSTISL